MPPDTAEPVLILSPAVAEMFGDPGPDLRIVPGWEGLGQIPAGERARIRILVAGGPRIDAALMDELPGLGLVAFMSAGYDSIDLSAARARGIKVSHAPGLNAGEVADLAMAMILGLLCGLPGGHHHALSGEWERSGRLPLRASLRGRQVGLVGMGAIGRELLPRLAPFGFDVAWWGPRPKPDVAVPRCESLLGLARRSDVLVVCNRPDPTGIPLVDRRILDELGRDAFLVNVARGSVCDEAALRSALREGRLAGAGLDVFVGETLNPAQWHGVPNVILSPHMGGATIESLHRQASAAKANIRHFRDGMPLPSPVPEP